MISDKELLHGAALLVLLGGCRPLRIHLVEASGVYAIDSPNTSLVLMLKYSSKPTSAWQFAFTEKDDRLLNELRRTKPETTAILGLVCAKDGVCRLAVADLPTIGLRVGELAGKAVSVSRRSGSSYRVHGPQRRPLGYTVPIGAWRELDMWDHQ